MVTEGGCPSGHQHWLGHRGGNDTECEIGNRNFHRGLLGALWNGEGRLYLGSHSFPAPVN